MDDSQQLLTVGDICRANNLPEHRVKYAITAYRIEPVQRAGVLRLFHPDQLPQILSAVHRVASRGEVAGAR